MKEIILLIALFTFIEFSAQAQRPANIEVPITVFDNSGIPISSRTLTCGIDSMATDSIDSFLGENWLFCPNAIDGNNSDCPPYDHFEALFNIPDDPPPGSFLFGSWKDFRYGVSPYSGTKTYEIEFITWSMATALFISWDFPEGVTGVLQDYFGGVIINYQMPDSGTYTHPALIQLNAVFLILTYQNAIPVELLSLAATLLSNNVKLDWSTATETNNSGFEIERASSSTTPVQEWETIGFVPGFGTTTEPKSYSFIDDDVSKGIYKYRLKQIDFDGSFEYSNKIEVVVDLTPKEFVLYQNYPNPFNPGTVISYQLPVTSNVTLKVYDVLGNEVATLVNEEKQPGVYKVEFNTGHSGEVRNLTSGIYFYQLRAGGFAETKKMILMK